MAKILLVEDDFATLSLLKAALDKAGHETEAAKNGKEALFIFEEFDADIVITDLVMPEMMGNKLISILKGRNPDLPIILIGNVIPAYHEADYALEKPLDLAKLKSVISELLKK